MTIFKKALADLTQNKSSIWGPKSFKDYLKDCNIKTASDTPRHISIDHFEKMPLELREADTMVLRLGESDGTGSQFGLVKIPGQLKDFFIIDEEIFAKTKIKTYIPTTTFHKIYPFSLLPNTSETTLVNYSMATGVLFSALNIDPSYEPSAPATGKSQYTFNVKPHSKLNTTFEHKKGQVEIDALFVGTHQNNQSLFIIEAKVGNNFPSLAKHKLVYPILGIANNIPRDMDIIPVYLRIIKAEEGTIFKIATLDFPDPRKTLPAIDELKISNTNIYLIPNL